MLYLYEAPCQTALQFISLSAAPSVPAVQVFSLQGYLKEPFLQMPLPSRDYLIT